MPRFYFPVQGLKPKFDHVMASQGVEVLPRKWSVTSFDCATLATRHKLHFPYQLLDIFLMSCNMEIAIDAGSKDEAIQELMAFRCMLLAEGVSPHITMFIATHSVNAYAGINSRDSDLLRQNLPLELQDGLRSGDEQVEAWVLEPALQVLRTGATELEAQVVERAFSAQPIWRVLCSKHEVLRAFQAGVLQAPMLRTNGQAVLHVWSALEGLFPSVTQEVAFKIALYLGCMQTGDARRLVYDRARAGYRLRSKLAHGSKQDCDRNAWDECWSLAMDTLRAVIMRRDLPSEESLIDELLPPVGEGNARRRKLPE